ncbi:hypothetical protein [Streptomyces spongiae]|uniref:MarR family transcriptional regulator n=1 Tax=Streptomyces spongiae TaxID=565072 RepID=A0A5N8XKT0_9ACTN|nr:hypothetical protein [Streptomyces spongiae]MPY59967.1 hypothetical protein [Streptomyces spongiae]
MARKFRITEEGRKRLTAQREETVAKLAKVLTGWSPEDLKRFVADLERFNTDIERVAGRPWPHSAR